MNQNLRADFTDFSTRIRETQQLIAKPGPSSQVNSPIPSRPLRLCCVIEGEDLVFPVDVSAEADVVDLKKKIHTERDLQDVGPHMLELWKPRDIDAIVAKPANTLPERIAESMRMRTSLEKLDPMDSLSDSFPTQPSKTHVHIVVVKTTVARVEKRLREEDDVPKAIKRLKKDVWKTSPSTLALPDQITGPDHNSAPTLRHCIRMSADMDKSSYNTLYDMNLTKDQQEKVQQKVEKTLQVLHDVHGDLRDTNVLIGIDSKSLDSNVKIHLVDFDCAGRIGEVK